MSLLNIDEKNQTVVSVAAVLVIILAVTFIFYRRAHKPVPANLMAYQGMGEVMAEETSKVLSGQGEVVVVTNSDAGAGSSFAIENFQRKPSGMTVKGVEKVNANAKPGTMEELDALVSKHGGADALVVFADSLDLEKLRQEKRTAAMPKVILMTSDVMGVRELLQQGAIKAAIVPRFRAPPEGMPEPHTPREWFENYYEIVTADDAMALPSRPVQP